VVRVRFFARALLLAGACHPPALTLCSGRAPRADASLPPAAGPAFAGAGPRPPSPPLRGPMGRYADERAARLLASGLDGPPLRGRASLRSHARAGRIVAYGAAGSRVVPRQRRQGYVSALVTHAAAGRALHPNHQPPNPPPSRLSASASPLRSRSLPRRARLLLVRLMRNPTLISTICNRIEIRDQATGLGEQPFTGSGFAR
jgi:hypothetical protein